VIRLLFELVTLPIDPLKDGSPKDYLHVQFSDGNAATVACKHLSEVFDEHGVRVDYAAERNDARPDSSSAHASIPPSSDLFVGNIPFDASESEIAALFNDQPGFIELKLGQVTPLFFNSLTEYLILVPFISCSDGLFRAQQRNCEGIF